MTRPDAQTVYAALDGTWPPARSFQDAGWIIREGLGGGQRTAAAKALSDAPDIAAMEAAQAAIGQPPLVMIRDGENRLDQALAQAGYEQRDITLLYVAPISLLATPPPLVSCFVTEWPPLQVQTEMWQNAGVGPARLAVMARVKGPKTTVLGRANDQIAGTAFVAVHGTIAMVHSLEVVSSQRRHGVAVNMMRGAAMWAQDQGAEWVAVAVTQANQGAISLYTTLQMELVGQYHYRAKPLQTA